MIYFAVGLAVIGVAAGLAFRWKVLLPIIVLVPVAAIIFSVSRGVKAADAVIIVLIAEAILQGGYFVGLVMRLVATSAMESAWFSRLFKRRRDHQAHDNAGEAR